MEHNLLVKDNFKKIALYDEINLHKNFIPVENNEDNLLPKVVFFYYLLILFQY